MSEIAKQIGQRIRNHRIKLGLSQEKLAEFSGVHHTYIGQLERGEKNATLESVEKISKALNLPLSKLFENLGEVKGNLRDIPSECYDFLSSKAFKEQERLFNILMEIEKYSKT